MGSSTTVIAVTWIYTSLETLYNQLSLETRRVSGAAIPGNIYVIMTTHLDRLKKKYQLLYMYWLVAADVIQRANEILQQHGVEIPSELKLQSARQYLSILFFHLSLYTFLCITLYLCCPSYLQVSTEQHVQKHYFVWRLSCQFAFFVSRSTEMGD